MGTMNLLQAGIKGSVGAHTGVRLNGKNVFKSKIWSKTPPTQRQKNNVRSFEALNRISGAIAKEFWQWLGYTQGNMYKHNVVAQHFKPIIKNHTFYPPNLQEVIPLSNKIEIRDYTLDPITGQVNIDVYANLPGINLGTQSALVLAFNGKGKVVFCERMRTPILTARFKTQVNYDFPYYLICFSSTKDGNKYRLADMAFSMTLPENVFYTEPHTKITWWTVQPNYLYGTGAGLSTDGVTLVVDDEIG